MERPRQTLETIEIKRRHYIPLATVDPDKPATRIYQENLKCFRRCLDNKCQGVDSVIREILFEKTKENLRNQTDRDVPISGVFTNLHEIVNTYKKIFKSATVLPEYVMDLTIALFFGDNPPKDIDFIKKCLENTQMPQNKV